MPESSRPLTAGRFLGSATRRGETLASLILPVMLASLAPGARAFQDDVVVDEHELEAFVDPVFEKSMRQEQIPGAVFVLVQWGDVVLAKGFGVADAESGRKVDPATTLFRIGSVSKAVTGVALSRLVDEHKVGLEDDVDALLKSLELDDRQPGPVRVRHLLTHTAGFDQRGLNRNFFDLSDPRAAPLRARGTPVDRSKRPTLHDFLAAELIRIRPPGEVPCYDTYGATLAGYLVQEISGKPFAEAMQELVFRPLGMQHTWIESPEKERANLATGYAIQEGRRLAAPYEYYATLPASSVDSTALDMAQLLIALLGDGSNAKGRLMSAEGAKAVLARQYFPRADFPGFTHLFFEEFRNGRRLIEHGGTMMGYSCKLVMLPEAGLGFFVACNRDGETGPPVQLHETLTRALMDSWFPTAAAPERPAKALAIDVARFAGSYAGVVYCHTCNEGEGWQRSEHAVRAVGPGTIDISGRRFLAVEPLLFAREDGRCRVLFREDANGRITHRFDSDNSASVYEKLGD